MFRSPRRLFLLLLSLLPIALPAAAQEISLTIDTGHGIETFDRARLRALPQVRLDTHTSVTDGLQSFTGPLMRDVLAAAGVTSDVVLASALNDYEIELPVEDFTRYDVIAALTWNGAAMTPRDKGPIWIVYPRDEFRELQDIYYDYRWVWQLIRLEAQ